MIMKGSMTRDRTSRETQRIGASLEGTLGLDISGSLGLDPGTVSSTPMLAGFLPLLCVLESTSGLTREGTNLLRSGMKSKEQHQKKYQENR